MKIEDEIKQPKFIDSHQKALINLIYTSNWLQGKQQEFFKPFGITAQQFNVLRILKGQHPKCISASEIKTRMLDRNSDISRILDRLIAKKLITKKSSQEDKRASNVFITEQGFAILKTIDHHQSTLDRILNLSDEDAEKLSNLLDKSRS